MTTNSDVEARLDDVTVARHSPSQSRWAGQETALEFGRFQMLLRRRQLIADGVPVKLSTRAFDLLSVLLEAHGSLVTKKELVSYVWPGVRVSEENLKVQISRLRKALGGDRDLIRTETGRGYRFVAAVKPASNSIDPHRGSSLRPQSHGLKQGSINPSLCSQIEAVIPRLRRYARAMVRDPVAADDLVQDALAQALGKIHLWEDGTDLRAWLFTILHNRHISLVRQAARQRRVVELQKFKPGSELLPDQLARLQLRDLERAIARLPEGQRSLILLIGLEGMSYDEAASVANMPVGTVRSRVSRGRETLRMMTGLFTGRHSRRSRNAVRSAPCWRQSPIRNHFQPPSPKTLQ